MRCGGGPKAPSSARTLLAGYLLVPDAGGGVADGDDDGLVVLLPDGDVELGDDDVLDDDPDDDVPGDADGVRSVLGRSPTRSVLDSLQPAIIAAPRARANTALSNFCISLPPVDDGIHRPPHRLQCKCHAPSALVH